MSEVRRTLLVGATGMVGRKVIAQGRTVPGISLCALARRELQLPRGARMELMLAETREWAGAINTIAPDAVICALGTTKAKSGLEGQRAVDVDLVLEVAQAAKQAGAQRFVMISSVGADAHAKQPYLQMKGEAEERLRKLRFQRLDILRPGLLRGVRYGETRTAEQIGQWVSPLVDLVMLGDKRKYRSIKADLVAAAALQAVRTPAAGSFVHEHDAILRLAGALRRERQAG